MRKCGLLSPMFGYTLGDMTDSMFAYVLAELEAKKGSWPQVAAGSGVPRRTLEKIASGQTKNPGVRHIERLAKYFREHRCHS
jgi:transcriptional regulator with XRE-family HTH domain